MDTRNHTIGGKWLNPSIQQEHSMGLSNNKTSGLNGFKLLSSLKLYFVCKPFRNFLGANLDGALRRTSLTLVQSQGEKNP